MRILTWIVGTVLAAVAVILVAVKLIYGMGQPYPDISTKPRKENTVAAIELPLPPGMVAASQDGRIFFTYHPFHQPQAVADNLLFEWVDGAARPFAPDLAERLVGVFGITVDRQSRLWAVRPGALEGKSTEVLALDINSGKIVFEYEFEEGEAGFAQDLRVSPDGSTVYLADTGLLQFTEASLIVLDVNERRSRTVLSGHESVAPQNWVMRRTDGSPYRLGYGLVTFAVGVDGIELTADGEWLVYAAMTHDTVYRVPATLLQDFSVNEGAIAAAVEAIGVAPMSDGIAIDSQGAVILTDVENAGLAILSADGDLATLVRVDGVDWADSVAVASNGDIWFTDSRLTTLLDQFGNPASQEKMAEKAPYYVYRIPAPGDS